MELFHSAILGLIQGLTEFLPISSSGHLVILPSLFGWKEHPLVFDVALHAASLCAILIYFRKEWSDILIDRQKRLFWYIAVATLPAVIVGSLIAKDAENYFRNPVGVSVFLGLFGAILLLAELYGKKERAFSQITLRMCIFIGLAQAVALVPGVSRSGVTMAAALALGMDRESSVKFSFLLGAPVIFAAFCYHLKELFEIDSVLPARYLLTGFISAFVSSMLAIHLLLKFVKSRPFTIFAVYRLLAAAVFIFFIFS